MPASATGLPTSSENPGTTTTTDPRVGLLDGLLEAAALFCDHDLAQHPDLTGGDYKAWIHEWDARMDNLRKTVNGARRSLFA